ncbi:DUF6777 domain-containing protein [Rhodococcus sp. NPDC058532]|uniref:DUF6777 domain-containing protein n=1 Tax=Rhodococcus sp. NPDC058532 TaxID=3346540 RepID=UPI003653498B
MAPDNGGRAAHRARHRTVATTGSHQGWPVRFAAVACVAVAATGCSQRGTDPEPVALLTTIQDGELPWTDVLLPPQTPTIVPPGPPGSELPADTTPVVTGDRGGLYGGSLERPLCDSARLVDDLEHDPVKLAAWSEVQGVSDVRGYVDALTPVLLRADTRVTGHGFDDGRTTARDAVLEAGTIVLIDDHGIPRVRCANGTPLSTPTSDVNPTPNVVPWPGFDPDRILVVRPSLDAMGMVSVVDIATGALTAVPVGSGPPGPTPAPTIPPAAPAPAPAPVQAAPVEQAPRRAAAEVPAPAPPPAPEPPPPPAPAPPEPAPEPVVVPQPPPPPAPPAEIRVEVPGLPPLVIPVPR